MSCKSLIGVATTTTAVVAAGAQLPLSTIIRRRTPCMGLAGNAVTISGTGSDYFLVTVSGTFTAPAVGVVTLALQQNGITVPGGTASNSVATADTEVRSISFTVPIRTTCGQTLDTLTVLNSGVAANFTNICVSVVKL